MIRTSSAKGATILLKSKPLRWVEQREKRFVFKIQLRASARVFRWGRWYDVHAHKESKQARFCSVPTWWEQLELSRKDDAFCFLCNRSL